MEVDAAIIGGGVVGLACAAALARARKNTVLLEQHRALATETSARSSEVIHAGLHYPPRSLKATMCVRGAELLYAWCASRGVPHARVGKIVVALDASEESALHALASRARDNGATVTLVDAAKVATMEPNVRAIAALHSPNTGIIDSHAFAASLAAEIVERGGVIARDRRVTAVERRGDRWVLECDGNVGRETIEAHVVVNAAGLWADDVAEMFGVDVDARGMRQRFVKGSYFRVKRPLVSGLVYPVPPTDGASLGIHTTVDLAGALRIGPDATPASRIDYAVDESRRGAFHAAASRYLVGLREDDLMADTAGIRPKVASGDFTIELDRAAVQLVGIESPGLTSALAIAERVAMLLS